MIDWLLRISTGAKDKVKRPEGLSASRWAPGEPLDFQLRNIVDVHQKECCIVLYRISYKWGWKECDRIATLSMIAPLLFDWVWMGPIFCTLHYLFSRISNLFFQQELVKLDKIGSVRKYKLGGLFLFPVVHKCHDKCDAVWTKYEAIYHKY